MAYAIKVGKGTGSSKYVKKVKVRYAFILDGQAKADYQSSHTDTAFDPPLSYMYDIETEIRDKKITDYSISWHDTGYKDDNTEYKITISGINTNYVQYNAKTGGGRVRFKVDSIIIMIEFSRGPVKYIYIK